MRVGTIIAVGVTIAVIGGAYAFMEYNRKPAGAGSGKAALVVSAEQLYAAFQSDEATARARYVGASEQVIEVNGHIREIDKNGEGLTNVILETGDDLGGVVCEFNEKDVPENWRAGSQVTVRGFCQGMLLDVILQRCVAVN